VLFGATFSVLRATHGGNWLRLAANHDSMPVLDGELTTRQVRQQASAVLPGVRVRRLVFWRYLLLWRKPIAS
jgi:hypothetical protein